MVTVEPALAVASVPSARACATEVIARATAGVVVSPSWSSIMDHSATSSVPATGAASVTSVVAPSAWAVNGDDAADIPTVITPAKALPPWSDIAAGRTSYTPCARAGVIEIVRRLLASSSVDAIARPGTAAVSPSRWTDMAAVPAGTLTGSSKSSVTDVVVAETPVRRGGIASRTMAEPEASDAGSAAAYMRPAAESPETYETVMGMPGAGSACIRRTVRPAMVTDVGTDEPPSHVTDQCAPACAGVGTAAAVPSAGGEAATRVTTGSLIVTSV